MKSTLFSVLLGVSVLGALPGGAHADDPAPMRAEGGAHTQPMQAQDGLSPEQRMNRRFPQKVRVGDLVGLPMQDYDDRILGYVEKVVRTADGRIVLVMPFGGWFGYGGRPVGVPIETVAILARHLNVLDIPREDFPALPSWKDGEGTPIPADDIIRIAISRR
ncbi:MAG TPA: PRC-barrel domain-containing protein [Ancylobacter sp.]